MHTVLTIAKRYRCEVEPYNNFVLCRPTSSCTYPLTFLLFRVMYDTNLEKEENSMLENEVDYRLAKLLLGCLYHDGLLTEKQMQKVWNKLMEYYHPPFQSIEVRDEIGDGVTVDER